MLIADDEPHIRELMKVIVEAMDGFETVAEASDGASAVELAKRLHPDMVLLDINMPELDGLEVLRQLKLIDAEIDVLMLTSLNSIDVVRRAIQRGAKNYILKDNKPEKIRNIIEQAGCERFDRLASAQPE